MTEIKPKAPIRRFDVFAEYNRQKAMADRMHADEAKGYALWLAKLVAARRFRRSAEAEGKEPREKPTTAEKPRRTGKWRELSGEPQTDEMFDREIVERMGRTFYRRVLVPSIKQAIQEGQSYESIRDTIRRDWKP